MNRPCSKDDEVSFFDMAAKCQEALQQQRAHVVHEQHQLVQEREAQINFVVCQKESGRRASLGILESVSKDCEIVRQEAQNCPRRLSEVRIGCSASFPGPKFNHWLSSYKKLGTIVSLLTQIDH